jgi:hypothetical protein
MMKQLRAEQLITGGARLVRLAEIARLQTLAHYQPIGLAPIPVPEIRA